MPLIIQGINVPVGTDKSEIIEKALKKAGLSSVRRAGIHKISLDARKRDNIHIAASVWADTGNVSAEKRICQRKEFCTLAADEIHMPRITGKLVPKGRIAVAGFGPAGMFAALVLSEAGYRPLVFERGGDMDQRVKAVNSFIGGGKFSPHTNVQFGEGGAGTFSDGKLTTRIKDPLCGYVSQRLHEFGAPEEILYSAGPHIGTDKLRDIVIGIRKRITACGGEIRFNSQVSDIEIKDGHIRSITVKDEKISVSALILAIGHSARDTFEMLYRRGVALEPKPFAVGARIEHLRQDVDRSLYGKYAGDPLLPAGEYRQSFTENGIGVYTFCMCPGGTVIAAQSEENTVVTNGMSLYSRSGENSNAAIVVSVSPAYYGTKVFDGVSFAREIEKKAYIAAGESYAAPACTVKAFLEGKGSLEGAAVVPTYPRGVAACDFDTILPGLVTEKMRQGIVKFGSRMECFKNGGAVLTAPETRTSSPIRIPRNAVLCSLSAEGLYPCGEGAGYAGGIMSAAVDGIRQAGAIMSVYKP